MTVNPPTTAQPVSTGYFLIGRELAPATLATVFTAVKAKPLKPVNKYTWLKDQAMWGDILELHDLQQGPVMAEIEIQESPLYGDSFGNFLFNFFGDYYTAGTAASPATTLNGAVAAGATTITVTSGTSITTGMWLQIDTGVNAEIVKVLSVATNVVTLATSTPTRFSHLTTVAVTNTTSPYVHTFAALNPASSTGLTNCQPPTHTLVHYNYLPGSGGFYADVFPYFCLSELMIKADANGWMTWSAKGNSYVQQAAAGTTTGAISTLKGIPAWKSTSTEASSAVNQLSTWDATWTRKMDIINTADGQQNPYFIGRGQMGSSFKLTVDPAIDESQLALMTGNTQPTMAWSVTNGLSGANAVTLAINSQLTGYEDAPLAADKQFWGYSVSGEFVGSATGAGNSGGNTLSQLVLTNATPSY
jgi:hypothetical protein